MTFEELGVDFLFVDEAHQFRKLPFATKQGESERHFPRRFRHGLGPLHEGPLSRQPAAWPVGGVRLGNARHQHDGRALLAQPVLAAETRWQAAACRTSTAWAQTFGDTKTAWSRTAAGSYQPVTRFAKFVNMPELYKMVGGVMDIVTPNQLEQYVMRPKLKDGQRQFHLAPRHRILDAYQADLGQRMQAIKPRKGPPQKGDDIILSVINDGRHAAIDPRFVVETPERPALETQQDGRERRPDLAGHREQAVLRSGDGLQEADRSAARRPRWSSPTWASTPAARAFRPTIGSRKRCAARAFRPNEIAFINDYKSSVASRAVQRHERREGPHPGRIDAEDGNRRQRATAPAMPCTTSTRSGIPADDEQRNGRILRQGNHNPEIQIHDYSTKGTYDSTMWQMMGSKAGFIEQFFRGDPDLRDMEDLGEAACMSRPRPCRRPTSVSSPLTELRQALDRAPRREAAHEREQYSLRQKQRSHASSRGIYDSIASGLREDIDRREPTDTVTVGGQTFDRRPEANAALATATADRADGLGKGADTVVARVGGFQVVMGRASDGGIYSACECPAVTRGNSEISPGAVARPPMMIS